MHQLSHIFIISLLLVGIVHAHEGHSHDHDEEDHVHDDDDLDLSYVTCGSVVKLKHVQSGYRLHSHQVTYGSGSGQQSVTGFPNNDDPNSFWGVYGPYDKHCSTGKPVKNGDIVRLHHLSTGKNLHSHLHKSPLTAQQEVSCFGSNDSGDTGDYWKVVIKNGDAQWKRDHVVMFQHVDTGKYLSSNKNKFNHPIPGQQEICGISQINKEVEWQAEEGFYFPSNVPDLD